MNERCVTAEQLAGVLELPDSDPRRAHVRECPRCRALALAYQDFMLMAEPLPAGARPKDARKRLDTALSAAILVDAASRAAAPDRLAARPAPPQRRTPWWAGFAPRPAWAVVGLLLVLGAGAVWMFLPRDRVNPLVLRNDGSRQRVDASFVLSPPQTDGVGRWRLSWTPVQGADAYQVRFFSSDLEELAQIEPTPVVSITVTRDQLGANQAGGNVVLWRVIALLGGDAIATSPVGTIALPVDSAPR